MSNLIRRTLNLRSRQSGFTLAELAVVASILGVSAYYGAQFQQTQNEVAKLEKAERDIGELQHAYNQFYTENRRAPADITEFVDGGYYQGDVV